MKGFVFLSCSGESGESLLKLMSESDNQELSLMPLKTNSQKNLHWTEQNLAHGE